jgi:hypothetical protein
MEAATVAVEAELRRVLEENLRLRGMLEELTRSYGVLYHQLHQVTHQQGHPHRHHPDVLMNNQLPPTLVSTHILQFLQPISTSPSDFFSFSSLRIICVSL